MLTMMERETGNSVEIGNQQKIVMSGITYAVIDQYKDMVYRAALAAVGNFADAEDIMQDVFFKYFKTQPEFESKGHEKAWFLRVTINESKNLLRSSWRSRRMDAEMTKISGKTESREMSPVLEAVLSLPEKYRIVIYLYYYEGYQIREIARITSQSEAAVSQQMSRGRKKLEKLLGGTKK
ncbi:MAG: sigma-70 family RNA polymerase sigma factor [Oscillospiraceae bacterium]|nr:sigma-70 family RNA polymerase sigma factor [Oscillospiraceae bacterium]